MKDLFFRFCRWALPLLGVGGAISCDNVIQGPDMYGCPPAEYGTPVMEFRVAGKVTDSQTGLPVKGVTVSTDDDWEDPEVITSDNGEFVYESQGFPSDKILMKFTDTDGSENGCYMDKELEVILKQVQSGSGNWDFGMYIAEDVQVKIDEDIPRSLSSSK